MYYIQAPRTEHTTPFILQCFLGLQEAKQLAQKATELFALHTVEVVDMETHSIIITITHDGKNGTPEKIPVDSVV